MNELTEMLIDVFGLQAFFISADKDNTTFVVRDRHDRMASVTRVSDEGFCIVSEKEFGT
jgi:hypothetical protein